MEAPTFIVTTVNKIFSNSRTCVLPSFDSKQNLAGPSSLQSRSRMNILRPSDSHQFCIPSLTVSTTSVCDIPKANSFNDIERSNSGSQLRVPNRYLRSRPSVTSENVITGLVPRDNGNGWIRRETKPLGMRPSKSFSASSQNRPKVRKLTVKEIERLALYERVGDTYGHIVGKNVGVFLTPYGFPVLQNRPSDFICESIFHSARNNSRLLSKIPDGQLGSHKLSSTPENEGHGDTPAIEVDITYDEMQMISLAALRVIGVGENKRVTIRADIASHVRRKRVIELVSKNGHYQCNKNVAFFRAQESHLNLSQIKLTAYTRNRRFGRRSLLGSTTISLRDLTSGRNTYTRPLHPTPPRMDRGRLRFVLCYHKQRRRLLVTVVRATNLPSKVLPPDTYVSVELHGSDGNVLAKARTKPKYFSNNPVYKEVFSFELPSCPVEDWDIRDIKHPLDVVTLTVTVHRKNPFVADDVIGCVTLRSEMRTNGYSHLWKCQASPYQPITEWHDLKSPNYS
ncbi:uncharacterized protein LOC121425578 [Lytechinus variegatus]|uniref:uncharacterized protein LOC121425578 n=1 Tax=Lytechinus variegatus TaxID=7654 RepID=UPI001BB22BBC|nr:uncharacterized protein LOC121425578 [Lytechinus variegatus]